MTGGLPPGYKVRRRLMSKKSIKYSEAMDELKDILDGLESESIDVDELSDKVKRSLALIKLCRQRIETTEVEIRKIVKEFEEN